MLTSLLACVAAAGAGNVAPPAEPLVEYVDSVAQTANQSAYSFAGVPIGDAHEDRRTILQICWSSSGQQTLDDLYFNGAPIDYKTATSTGGGVAIAWVDVPSGTTASIDVTFSGTVQNCYIQTFRSTTPNFCPQRFDMIRFGAASTRTSDCVPLKPENALMVLGASNAASSPVITLTYDGSLRTPSIVETVEVSSNERGAWIVLNEPRKFAGTVLSGANSNKAQIVSTWAPVDLSEKVREVGWGIVTSTGATQTVLNMGLGKPAANRIVIAAITWDGASNTLTSCTINGVTATIVVQTSANSRGAAIAYAAVPDDEVGDVVIQLSGITTRRQVRLYAAYPASAVPLDSVSGGVVSAADLTLADLQVADGGFAIVAATHNWDGELAIAWGGVDVPTLEQDWIPTTANRHKSWLIKTTEDATTFDVVLSSVGDVSTKRAVAASWL